MKKLLTFLKAIVLTTSTSTSVIACGGGEKLAKHKTDNEIINDIKITLEDNGVEGLTLNNLQKQSSAQNLIKTAIKTVTDQNKVKEATFTFVAGNSLLKSGDNIVNIEVTFNTLKPVAVAVKLIGIKVYTPIDLRDLIAPSNNIIVEVNEYYKISSFWSNLINELKSQTNFNSLNFSEVDITKADGNGLEDDDIDVGTLKIKIKAKSKSKKFSNEKIMDVTISNSVKSQIAYLESRVMSNSSLLNGNDLYVGTAYGYIYKIDITNNNVTEIANLGGSLPIPTNLILNGNNLYVGADRKVYKIDITNNNVTEIANLGASFNNLVLNGNNLYVGADRKVYKIDITNNNVTEIANLDEVVNCLVLNGNNLYVGTTKIYQINIITNNITEIANLGFSASSLVLNNNALYIGTHIRTQSHLIYKIDITTKVRTEIAIWGSKSIDVMLVNANNLYIGTQLGHIYKIDTTTNVRTEIVYLGIWVKSLVLNGNVLYVGTLSNNIYKVEF